MAVATGTALALGAGGVLGGLAGGQDDVTTSQRNVAPASAMERDLQNKSMENYLQQIALANQQENAIAGTEPLQSQSRGSIQNILSGQSFNISPEQQLAINRVRDANIAAGRGDITNFVQNQLSGVSDMAGQRGVRGQALSELQGRAIGEGTRQYGNLVAQANAQAAQQAMDNPYRQASLQGSLAQQNVSIQDQMRQQAIQNRQQLQNPALMSSLQNERLAAAGTTQTNQANFGDIAGGILGGIGGVAGGIGAMNRKWAGGRIEGYAEGGRVPEKKPEDRGWSQKDKEDFSRGAREGGGGMITDSIRSMFAGENDKRIRNYSNGGEVDGHAPMRGDHPMNDNVPAMLSPGEIVIPRSFAHDPKLAKAFIDYIVRKEKEEKKERS